MNERVIAISAEKDAAIYLEQLFEHRGITYRKEEENAIANYFFSEPKEEKDWLISELLINFYKYDALFKAMGAVAEKEFPFYAYVGAILGLDSQAEREKIIEKLSQDDIVNIDGFYNFCLGELQESWQALGTLSLKLYRQCKTAEDVYSLTSFMLGVDENDASVITLDNAIKMCLIKDGKTIEIIPFTGDAERDTVITMLSYNPSDIIITEPRLMSDDFMSVIRALGD